MDLHYNIWTKEIEEVEERLRALSLQYKLSEKKGISVPVLFSGKIPYKGLSSIHTFIDQLEEEAPQWWYCNC